MFNLGILGVSSELFKLEFLFTAIAEFASELVRCNEFQDVYLIELKNEDRDSYKFDSLGDSEVTAVEFFPVYVLEKALREKDPAYVVRPDKYRERFFEILHERFSR